MTEGTALTVFPRDVIGHANRRLAAENRVPAVIYAKGKETSSVSVDRHDLEYYLSHFGHSGLVELKVEGESKPVNAVFRDIQYSAVKGAVIHVDFMAVKMNEALQTTVPLHVVGDAEGVKLGGVLNQNIHEINIEALPANIPDAVEADVSALNVGDTITLADVVMPDGVKLLDDPELLVASVMGQKAEEEEVVAEEAAEPEVIGAKPEEE